MFQVENLLKKGLTYVYLNDTQLPIDELCNGADLIFSSPGSLLDSHRELLIKLSQTGVLKVFQY